MQTFWADVYNDLRYALRQLRHAPGFAAAAVLTLALGIGATIGVYTLVDAVLLRPLPYRAPSNLFILDSKDSFLSYGNLLQFPERSHHQIEAAAVLAMWNAKLEANDNRIPATIVEVSANLPAFLGVQPLIGRSFRDNENDPGRSDVMLLSCRAWQKVFAADRDVLGKRVQISGGHTYTVIGVMPPTFAIPMDDSMQVWTPRAIPPAGRIQVDATKDDAMFVHQAFVRPAAGISTAQMLSELRYIQGQIAAEHPASEVAQSFSGTPYLASINRGSRRPLLLLLGMGTSFWLLASLNVVGLLIARATAREREFAVRSALGATRGRLLRQSIVESLVLSITGSLCGISLATTAIKLLWHSITRSLPLTERIHIDAHVVLALTVITILTALIVGVLPAFRASGTTPQSGLRGGTVSLPRVGQHRLRSTLIAAQLMITVVLLAGAGLFLRTVLALRSVPLGFTEQNVLTGGIMHPMGLAVISRKGDAGMAQRVYMPLLDRLNHMPGVESATLSSVLPMRSDFQIQLDGEVDGKKTFGARKYSALGRAASAGLLKTFGVPILRGRYFSDEDTPSSAPVVVINKSFADTFLPDTDPLNHTFGLGTDGPDKGRFSAMRIIGVIGDVKQGSVDEPTKPEVYLCLAQITPGHPMYPPITAFMQVGIRARIPAQLLRKQFESALDHIDPDAQTIDVKTVHEAVEDSFGTQALIAHLLEGFSLMALLIALVGVYGTVAYSVAQRTREFGVRLALGAPQQSIRQLVMQKAMWPVVTGLIAGNITLWFATKLVRSYLFGISGHDSATLMIASCMLVATGFIAALIPALRAASTDPMTALRTE
jgi:predicted permease